MGHCGSECMAISAAAAAVRRHRIFRVITSVLCTHRWAAEKQGWEARIQRSFMLAASPPCSAMLFGQGSRQGQTTVLSETSPAPTLSAGSIETSCSPETGMPMQSRPGWAHSCTLLSTSGTALWYSSVVQLCKVFAMKELGQSTLMC